MEFSCPNCHRSFIGVDESLDGEPARCEECDYKFIIPFADSDRLLNWATTAPWDHLEEGNRSGVARGHSEKIVTQFIQTFEKRREQEIWRIEREQQGKIVSQQERIWEASEKRLRRRKKLASLQAMTASGFKRLIADLFSAQGYVAEIPTTDAHGFDLILSSDSTSDKIPAICRVRGQRKVSSTEVRAAALKLQKEAGEEAFFFTSGRFTKNAYHLADKYNWLSLHDGPSILKMMRKLARRQSIKLSICDYDPAHLLADLTSKRNQNQIDDDEFNSKRQQILEEFT